MTDPLPSKIRDHGTASGLGAFTAWLEDQGVWLPLAIGLVARCILITTMFHWSTAPVTSDDATYVRFAEGLLRTGRFETNHFPVGYPLFIAPFLMLGSAAFPLIRIAHVALGVLTILIVSRIAALLYGSRAGLLAAWIAALYPPLVFMTGRIMSETLFIALLMLSLYEFLLSDRDQNVARSARAGAFLALASLARSNLVVMFPFVPLWFLAKRSSALRGRLLRALAFTAVAGTILMLPGFYFLQVRGEFTPFATNAGQTFYGANNPLANGGWVDVEAHPELVQSIPPEVRHSPSAYSKAQQSLGVRWIRENPAAFLSLLPKKFANAWIPGFQTSETTSRSRVAKVVLALTAGLLLLGAIVGRLLIEPAQRDGILLAVLVTYTVMSLAFYGNPRIGLFCAPVLIVYAAACVAKLLGRAKASDELTS